MTGVLTLRRSHNTYCQKRLDNSVRRSSLQISAGNDAAEDEGN